MKITAHIAALALVLAHSCADKDSSSRENISQTQSSDFTSDNDEVSRPEVISGSYLTAKIEKFDNGKDARVTASLEKNGGEKVLPSLGPQIDTISWSLVVDGQSIGNPQSYVAALTETIQTSDPIWIIKLRPDGSVPDVRPVLRIVFKDSIVAKLGGLKDDSVQVTTAANTIVEPILKTLTGGGSTDGGGGNTNTTGGSSGNSTGGTGTEGSLDLYTRISGYVPSIFSSWNFTTTLQSDKKVLFFAVRPFDLSSTEYILIRTAQNETDNDCTVSPKTGFLIGYDKTQLDAAARGFIDGSEWISSERYYVFCVYRFDKTYERVISKVENPDFNGNGSSVPWMFDVTLFTPVTLSFIYPASSSVPNVSKVQIMRREGTTPPNCEPGTFSTQVAFTTISAFLYPAGQKFEWKDTDALAGRTYTYRFCLFNKKELLIDSTSRTVTTQVN